MGLPTKEGDKGEDDQRVIDFGRPEHHPPFADNSVTTSKYTILSFFPLVSFQITDPVFSNLQSILSFMSCWIAVG